MTDVILRIVLALILAALLGTVPPDSGLVPPHAAETTADRPAWDQLHPQGSGAMVTPTEDVQRAAARRHRPEGVVSADSGLVPPVEAIQGRANFADRSHGDSYLAMRLPRGSVVDICGAGGCWNGARTTDYGPAKRTGDIADIALVKFAHVCGWTIAKAKRMGECEVEIVIHGRVELPATDTLP